MFSSPPLLTSGVKSYPRGVTTNSSSGIEDYGVYYPVFKAMEEEGMVLNLHGEVPSDDEKVSHRIGSARLPSAAFTYAAYS